MHLDYMLVCLYYFFFFNDTATTEIYTLSLHDALPIWVISLNFPFFGSVKICDLPFSALWNCSGCTGFPHRFPRFFGYFPCARRVCRSCLPLLALWNCSGCTGFPHRFPRFFGYFPCVRRVCRFCLPLLVCCRSEE